MARSLIFTLILLCSSILHAVESPSTASSLGLSLNIQETVLENGLRLIVLEDHRSPLFSFQSWFNVGSADEHPGKTGIAHLFEHMMFNGTPKYPQGKYDSEIEKFGGSNNAFTSRDYTGYYVDIEKEQLEQIIKLESDRMVNIFINPDTLDRERQVVLEERKLRVDNSLYGRGMEELYLKAFKTSPYRWPVIGFQKDVEGISVKDCENFYKTFYSPNNAIVVIAGDVKYKDVLKLAKKYYGKIPSSKLPTRQFKKETQQKEERRSELHLPAQSEILLIGYKIPALNDVNEYAYKILNQILFYGASSRAQKKLVYEKQLVTNLGSDMDLRKDPSLLIISASLHPGKKGREVEKVLENVLKKVKTELITPAELQKAVNQRISSRVSSMKTMSGLASSLAYYEVMYGDYKKLLSDLEKYQTVTAEDIRKAAKQVFQTKQRTVVTIIPKVKS